MNKILIAYGAGTLGAVANFAFGIVLTATGVMTALGIILPPPAMPEALYQRLVWGGIWGAALLLPFWRGNILVKGLLLGMLPSLIAGLVLFPSRGLGQFGANAGAFFPVLIFCFNWVWGVVSIAIYRIANR